MSTEVAKKETIETLLANVNIKKRIEAILGKNAGTFTSSVIQLVKSHDSLMECEPMTVIGAALTAACLDLPISNELGFAYIVPYNKTLPNKQKIKVAQFQMGYKGFVQLGLRTGQYHTINVTDVKKGEILHEDRLTGHIEFGWLPRQTRDKAVTVGYVAYIELLSGFRKQWYMSVQNLEKHGKKYSKSFAQKEGLWKKDPETMYGKTPLKLLLSKYGILSVDNKMQIALRADQAVIDDLDPENIDQSQYVDNQPEKIDPEKERVILLIEQAEEHLELDMAVESPYGEELLHLIKEKRQELNEKGVKE